MTDPASLQNLHPIIIPPQVGLWPLAPGWYIVIFFVLIISAQFLYNFLRKRKENRYRKVALQHLAVMRSQLQEEQGAVLRELPVFVKSVALEVYPRPDIAGLHGKDWLIFLDKTIGSTAFTKGPGHLLPQLSYQPLDSLMQLEQNTIDELTALIEDWISNHRPLTPDDEGRNV